MKTWNIIRLFLISGALICALSVGAAAETEEKTSEEKPIVKVPLPFYNNLIEQARFGRKDPQEDPSNYTLGKAVVRASVEEIASRPVATVTVALDFSVSRTEWTSIPLFPAGLSIASADFGNAPAKLSYTPQGVFWNTNQPGNYHLVTKYKVDALRSEGGYSIPLSTPQAASIVFEATLPNSALDALVTPSAGTEIAGGGEESVTVKSVIPPTPGFQLYWKTPLSRGYALSRADYRGVLHEKEQSISWTALLSVEVFGKETAVLPLLPTTATLSDLKADDKTAPILIEGGRFVTKVRGEGAHTVRVDFETPVLKQENSPSVELFIPRVPISRFELLLPERKEITVNPLSNVSYREEKNGVTATIFAPLSDSLSLSWTEAVPEEAKEDLRSSANAVHTFYAEDGVLYGRAIMNYEITRGKGSVLEIDLPDGIQVNRINAATTPIADWRIFPAEEGNPSRMQVFFEHELAGALGFEVEYDMPVNAELGKVGFELPILRSREAHRQRGMLAMLSSRDFGLRPLDEQGVTKVGENQLPPAVRVASEKMVTHTYKYGDTMPAVKVQLAKPERREGKFDAIANTLLSLSDATMTASSNVEVNVKAGSIDLIQLELPKSVNILGLTAPSLRTQKVSTEGEKQVVEVQFTQDMEGQFRIELSYEQILAKNDAEFTAPTLTVRGAELQQGKIAVEAVSAVEVQASATEQLSSFDANDLPQQLLLKTSNPILHAYSYIRTDPPYKLALKVTRHREIEMQEATIDTAEYRTLFTHDGLAVTTARFMVRNSRKQFLRVDLPAGAKVWSAAVDNSAEKPALAEATGPESAAPQVMLKIRSSVQAFPVDLIYQAPTSAVGSFGVLRGVLPRPDIVVTDSHWDVYLPDDLNYGTVRTNLRLTREAEPVSSFAGTESVATQGPLKVVVPAAGLRYSFEKLYANQSFEDAFVDIPFANALGRGIGIASLLIAIAIINIGLWLTLYGGHRSGILLSLIGAAAVIHLQQRHGIDYRIALRAIGFCVALAVLATGREYALRFYKRRQIESESEGKIV